MLKFVKNGTFDVDERIADRNIHLNSYGIDEPFEDDVVYNVILKKITDEEREGLLKMKVLIPKRVQVIRSNGVLEAIAYFGYGFSARLSKVDGVIENEVTEQANSFYSKEMIENSVGFLEVTILLPNRLNVA